MPDKILSDNIIGEGGNVDVGFWEEGGEQLLDAGEVFRFDREALQQGLKMIATFM